MSSPFTKSLYISAILLVVLTAIMPLPVYSKNDVLPTPLMGRSLRKQAEKMELFTLDREPLAKRQPLLLVHGLLAEKYPLYRWDKVIEHLLRSSDFKSRYKIYLVRYDSHSELEELERSIGETIVRLRGICKSPITVVSLSLGGNIVNTSMNTEKVDGAVDKVIAMASMFQGSPLFVTDWAYKSILTNHKTPWVRMDKLFCYKAYFSKHRNLLEDIGWSDLDKCKPGNLEQKGGVLWSKFKVNAPSKSDSQLNTKNKSASKFTLYASYLENQYVLGKNHGFFKKMLGAPVNFVRETVPQHMGREHAVLSMLNRHLAEFPAVDKKDNQVKARSFLYNDGIIPVASSLVLPGHEIKVSPDDLTDLKNLPQLTSIKKARLFPRCDHLSFIDGFHQGKAELIVDKLNPDDKPRLIYDWLLYDLLKTE